MSVTNVAFLGIFADETSIYAITGDGSLVWYRDELRDGTNGPNAERGWAPGSGSQIGRGWDGFTSVFSGGGGVIYAIRETGELLWYHDELRDGTNGPNAERGWAARSGSPIGIGWSIEPRTRITGYASPLSVTLGDTIDIKLSARHDALCTVELFRLRENGDGTTGVSVTAPMDVPVSRQSTPTDAWQSGCHWHTTVSFQIDHSWPSGLYSARASASGDSHLFDVVFVVRPGDSRRDFLLVANTNCWNAYNAWGGVSNYSNHAEVVTLSFERPNPEAAPNARTNGHYSSNHLRAAEIWISTWLEDAGYEFDTCSDLDFHRGDPDLTAYKAVILSTHPEYWSQQMAQRLSNYVAGEGKLLYWGGNGIFRQVEFTHDGLSMTTGSSPAWFCGNAWGGGPKPRALLGVAYDIAHDGLYPQRCGYVIDTPSHRFLAGTGLAQGDVIGTSGRNGGGACGWEADTAIDFGEGNGAAPAGEVILGHGELVTAAGYTGHMTYHENDAGGLSLQSARYPSAGAFGPMQTCRPSRGMHSRRVSRDELLAQPRNELNFSLLVGLLGTRLL